VTIAIGYRCHNGVVLAADTLTAIGEEAHEGQKLMKFWAKSGAFGFVHASDDANATISLIAEMRREIERTVLSDYHQLGTVIKKQMTDWRQAFGRKKPPFSHIILGVKLNSLPPTLFFCEAPNTFREIGDYIAIGGGAAVTDFLHKYLFSHLGGEYLSAPAILRRIAYMIYRAKKDTTVCGKNTHATVIFRSEIEPILVSMEDMEAAEKNSTALDLLLGCVAEFSLDSTAENINHNTAELVDTLNASVSLRMAPFRDIYGNDIKQ
jgi:20S proteasome alpha/beta subunit